MEKMLDLIETSPELLKMIYKDLAKPGVKKLGMALETIIDLSNTILLPIKLLNEKTRLIFKRNINNYRKKIESIETEDIIDVPPEIGLPIIEKLTYISNEELSDLFINILTKASSRKTVKMAHPSFIEIIKSLSVDEARIIKYLKNKNVIPFLEIKSRFNDKSDFSVEERNMTGIEYEIELMFVENIDLYFNNLESMGILTNLKNTKLSDEEIYINLEATYSGLIDDLKNSGEDYYGKPYKETEVYRGVYEVTSFGKKFINACTENF